MTLEMNTFIESMFFVFIATGIAKSLTLIMNYFGGRILGPGLYGEYTLIISVAAFLVIPIGLGILGGITKTLAETQSYSRQRKIVSTASIYLIGTLIVMTAIYLIFYKQIANAIHIGNNLFILAILFALVNVGASLIGSILLGLHKQKTWAYMTAISNLIAFCIFIIAVLSINNSLLIIYVPTSVAFFLFSIIGFLLLKKYIFPLKFNRPIFKETFNYGIYHFFIIIANTVLGNVDKVMLGFMIDAVSVGLYQAYYLSSIMIMGVLSGVFVQVFFPTAVKLQDKKGILKKINKMIPLTIITTLVLTAIFEYVGVKYLYNYEFFLSTASIFVITTIATTVFVIYTTFLSSFGVAGVKKTAIIVFLGMFLNILLNYMLIPKFQINGAAIATLISYVLMCVASILLVNKHTKIYKLT